MAKKELSTADIESPADIDTDYKDAPKGPASVAPEEVAAPNVEAERVRGSIVASVSPEHESNPATDVKDKEQRKLDRAAKRTARSEQLASKKELKKKIANFLKINQNKRKIKPDRFEEIVRQAMDLKDGLTAVKEEIKRYPSGVGSTDLEELSKEIDDVVERLAAVKLKEAISKPVNTHSPTTIAFSHENLTNFGTPNSQDNGASNNEEDDMEYGDPLEEEPDNMKYFDVPEGPPSVVPVEASVTVKAISKEEEYPDDFETDEDEAEEVPEELSDVEYEDDFEPVEEMVTTPSELDPADKSRDVVVGMAVEAPNSPINSEKIDHGHSSGHAVTADISMEQEKVAASSVLNEAGTLVTTSTPIAEEPATIIIPFANSSVGYELYESLAMEVKEGIEQLCRLAKEHQVDEVRRALEPTQKAFDNLQEKISAKSSLEEVKAAYHELATTFEIASTTAKAIVPEAPVTVRSEPSEANNNNKKTWSQYFAPLFDLIANAIRTLGEMLGLVKPQSAPDTTAIAAITKHYKERMAQITTNAPKPEINEPTPPPSQHSTGPSK